MKGIVLVICIILLAAFAAVCGTVAAQSTDNGSSASGSSGLWSWFNPGNWVNTTINTIISRAADLFSKAFEALFKQVLNWLNNFLGRLERPASDYMPTKDLWKKSFDIYISTLLPLSLAILAIFIMFSSQPPSRAVLDEYVKRVAAATALAYFSFPIVDTLIWLTNEISAMILHAFVGPADIATAAVTLAGEVAILLKIGSAVAGAAAAASGGGAAIGLAGVLPYLFFIILTAIIVIGLRWILVHLLLGVMPILCFFMIIGVGPLKKLNSFVEFVWGLLLELPMFSILGAMIIVGIVRFSNVGVLWAAGPLIGLPVALAPLALVFAFPFITMQGLGMFSSAVHSLAYPMARFMRGPLAAIGAARGLHLERTLGPAAAPLGAVLPTKLAIPPASAMEKLHIGGAKLGSKVFSAAGGILPGRLGGAKAIGKAIDLDLYSRRLQHTRDFAGQVGDAFKRNPAAVGALAGLAGAAGKIGKVIDARDPAVRKGLSDVSLELAQHAKAGDIGSLSKGLSALYGKEHVSVREGLLKALRSNFELARKSKDPGVTGVAALLASKNDPAKLAKAFRSNPGLVEALAKSEFAQEFLNTYGITQRDLGDLLSSDSPTALKAAEHISTKLSEVEIDTNSALLGNTLSALTTDGNVSDALVSDLSGLDDVALEDVADVLSDATKLPRAEVLELVESAGMGDHSAASRLAMHMGGSGAERLRAIIATASTIKPEHLNIEGIDDHMAARRLGRFLTAGGLITTEVRPEMADLYRNIQMHAARKAVKEARWKEYISSRAGEYSKAALGPRAPEWLPEAYEIDYRTMLDDDLGYIF